MTKADTIRIRSCFANGVEFHKLQDEETTRLALEMEAAIEKQIPQKPWGVHALPHNAWGLCPRCKGGPVREGEIDPRVVFNPWDYCPYCGQALDWSDWEER